MKLFTISILLFAQAVYADQVYNILKSRDNVENHLVLTTDGHVFELPLNKKKLASKLFKAFKEQTYISLEFAKDNSTRKVIKNIKSGLSPNKILHTSVVKNRVGPSENFNISVLDSYQEAVEIFNTMKPNANKDSQCYNRAHVWAKEMFSSHEVNSTKHWLFFTQKYIREFKFKWWFHIAPSVITLGKYDDEYFLYIMDRKYASKPLSVRTWTDIFMQNDAKCEQVYDYSSYRQNPESGYCFLIQSSMYYWQPYQIKNLENNYRSARSQWHDSEINIAYGDAF